MPTTSGLTIKQNLGRGPRNNKLNEEIVSRMKGWFETGVSCSEAHAWVRALGYKVSLNTVADIKGGRRWEMVRAKRSRISD